MSCFLCSCQMSDTIYLFQIHDISVFVVSQSLALSGPFVVLSVLEELLDVKQGTWGSNL